MLKEMNSLQFGEFTIDPNTRELRRQHLVLPVTGKVFDLLVYMAENPGRLLSKSELLDALWPETSVEESSLSQNVFLLRKALDSEGLIRTVPGRGYLFTAQVKEIRAASRFSFEAAQTEAGSRVGLQATHTRVVMEDEVEDHLALQPTQRRLLLYLCLFAVSGVIGWLCWLGWQRWQDHTGGPPLKVVLTTMEGTTGDPILDRALTEAFRIDLAQSPFVSPLPVSTVRTTLTQMSHKPDEAVTADLAREICERTNSQAVVHGTIARIGQSFLLTQEATSCVDGNMLATAKDEAKSAEDLPHSLDIIAARLRQKLGESRRSIARFNAPLFADAASLDALKAYTQGTDENARGNAGRAVALFEEAVTADPNFATAYYALYSAYGNAGDFPAARMAIAQAYKLRETTSKSLQFAITATYNTTMTQDMYESLRIDQNWTQLYPNSALAWNRLSNLQSSFGDYAAAARSAQRAVHLQPSAVLVNCLASAQLQSGDPKGAQATLDQAIADGLDGDRIRIRYLELAYALHDEGMLRAQMKWANAHPEATAVLGSEIQIANAEGRFSDAHKLITQLKEAYRQQGVADGGDALSKAQAVQLIQAGDVDAGKLLLATGPVNIEEGPQVVGLAYAGNIPAAKSALREMHAKYPNGTLWNLYWGPQTLAVIAMSDQKPADAASILEITRPMEKRELIVPWMRGSAYLAAGQPSLAEKDFRSVVTHPEIDSTSVAIPLSWLGLGRTLASQHRIAEARDAYQRFFILWAHADPDAVFLFQAKQEYAILKPPLQ